MILLLLTQNPDAPSSPSSVSSSVGARLCLAVMDWRANNNVWAPAPTSGGCAPPRFRLASRAPASSARGREGLTVRAAFIKQTEAEEIGRRAVALRTAAGTLSGEAAGHAVEEVDTSTVVDHLRAVWPDGSEAVHSPDLVAALAAYRPDLYAAWLEIEGKDDVDTEAKRSGMLSNALKPFGVRTGQVKRRGRSGNRKGVRWEDLQRAAPADNEDP